MHTTVYTSNWEGVGNSNNYFYCAETFGILDLCKPIKASQTFRSNINKVQECSGQWCQEGQYSCKYDMALCYHVEHIIDSSSRSGLSSECTNIAGNMIMAYSKWNRGLGDLSYEDSTNEKKEVYGDIYDRALANIMTCNPDCVIEKQLVVEQGFDTFETVSVGVFSAICAAIIMWLKRRCEKLCTKKPTPINVELLSDV